MDRALGLTLECSSFFLTPSFITMVRASFQSSINPLRRTLNPLSSIQPISLIKLLAGHPNAFSFSE